MYILIKNVKENRDIWCLSSKTQKFNTLIFEHISFKDINTLDSDFLGFGSLKWTVGTLQGCKQHHNEISAIQLNKIKVYISFFHQKFIYIFLL